MNNKICPRPGCNTVHTKNGLFCCRSCANSRIFSAESREKKSKSARDYINNLSVDEKALYNKRLVIGGQLFQKQLVETILSISFDELTYYSKRKRVIIEQSGKCLRCNIDTWQDQPITLELDHIDGNHSNNVRENLNALCPNCHSLTPTWRGKSNLTSQRSNRLGRQLSISRNLRGQ